MKALFENISEFFTYDRRLRQALTDKQDFLTKLRAALVERDVAESDIEPYIERFDRFFDRMVQDPEKDNLLSDVEHIADNIAEQISERYDEMNRLAERTLTVDRVKDDTEQNGASEGAGAGTIEPKKSASDTAPATSDRPESSEKTDSSGAQGESAPAQERVKAHSSHASIDAAPRSEVPPVPVARRADHGYENDGQMTDIPDEPRRSQIPEYIDEEPSPNSRMFWILFAVSLPVTIPLAILGFAVFAAMWVALAALIVAAVVALVGVVAGGTATSLVGVVYGITKLFSSLPVGLYEIGLGVMVGSAVMFAGILLYNFAIRLLPWLMRLVGRLFMYVCRQLGVLFRFLRRECAKL